MSKLFSRATSKLSLFWRYFLILCAVIVLFLVGFSATSRQFTKALQTSYLEQAQANFNQTCNSFSNKLFLTHSLPPALENTEHYAAVSIAEQPLTPRSAYYFSEIRTSFATQCALLDLSSECFVYFSRSDSCVTRTRIFSNADDCFDSYLLFQPQEGRPTIQDQIRSDERMHVLRLLPLQQVSVGGDAYAPYLVLLIRSTYGEATYGFLFSADSLLEYFHLNALPEDTSLSLTSRDGSVLFSHGNPQDAQQEYTQLSCDLPSLSCTAAISIPQSYFQAATRSVQNIVLLILLVTVVVGLLLCLFLSHLCAKPFRRLISDHSITQVVDDADNELVAIDRFLKNTQEKNASLRSMLLSSLLVRAFSGQPIREDEYQKLCVAFPLFQEPLRAAVVHDRASSYTLESHSSMFSLLREALPGDFLCEYINIQETLVLFPADPILYEQLNRTLLDLNRDSEPSARFVCGVSAPFIGLSELSNSIRQAQFCVPENDERAVIPFSEEAKAFDPAAKLPIFDLKQFQQALSTWNQHEMLGMVERYAAYADKHPSIHPEEVFYSILFLLRDTAQAGKLSFASHEKTTYLHTGSPASNLRQLCGVIDDLFRQRSSLQLSDRQRTCEDIVQYIKDHFPDPTLCLFSLAQHFCVSERFAHNAIQSMTGMNFSNFLSLTRMQEAARLLRETDSSIHSVAEQCGYPAISTFYRNFKKHYLVTPAEYKDSLS